MNQDSPERTSNVRKAVIVPYTDKDYRNKVKDTEFVIPVNPESYSQNFKVEVDRTRAHGNQKTGPRFKSTAPEELKLEFIIDGTGTIEGYWYDDHTVGQQINLFKKVVYNFNGDIHRPNFIKVFWGDFTFQCILTNLDINYTLFDWDGSPLRAKISATFTDFVAQEERAARERARSPDITHFRDVPAGQRMDLMTHEIYKTSKWTLHVSKSNNLTSFRQTLTGTELIFPPLSKTE